MSTHVFIISKKEINRRVGAFFSLAICWPVIMACISLFLPADDRMEVVTLAISILVAMLIMGILTTYFLKKTHSHTTFKLTNNSFERLVNSRVKDKIDLSCVTRIHIKYVATGAIRQITLTVANRYEHNIDGVEQFETMRANLTRLCSRATISSWREPINYDHWLFYPALGAVLSVVSVLALMLMSFAADSQAGHLTIFGVTILCAGVAAYIAVARPLRRQYGLSARKADWILAVSLATGAIVSAILAL